MQNSNKPHIVALHATCETSLGLQGIQLWLGQYAATLVELDLCMGSSVPFDTLLATLRALSGHLPKLQILQLDAKLEHLGPGQKLDLALEAKGLCSSLHNLLSLRLSLDTIDAGGLSAPFNTLAQLPELENLVLYTNKTQDTPSATALSQRPDGFKKLRTLHISGPLDKWIQVFGSLSGAIQDLHLECPDIQNPHDLRQALNAAVSSTPSTSTVLPNTHFPLSALAMASLFAPGGIPRCVGTSSLTNVTINILRSAPQHDIWASLQALYPARGMCSFSISFPYSLSYTPENLRDLFQAWPRVQHLSLNPRPTGSSSHPLPPLEVLADAATSAPYLESFAVFLDGIIPSATPALTWSPHVKTLDLGYTRGSEAESEVVGARRYIERCFGVGVQLVEQDCSSWVVRVSQIDTVSQDW